MGERTPRCKSTRSPREVLQLNDMHVYEVNSNRTTLINRGRWRRELSEHVEWSSGNSVFVGAALNFWKFILVKEGVDIEWRGTNVCLTNFNNFMQPFKQVQAHLHGMKNRLPNNG